MAITVAAPLNIAVNTAVMNALDSGSGNALVKLYTAANVLLATCVLADPCGTVNGTTGQLTLSFSARDESADASGTAAYAAFCTSAGTEQFRLSCVESATPVSNSFAMPNLAVIALVPFEISSAVIG
jgi:hypothetical protein